MDQRVLLIGNIIGAVLQSIYCAIFILETKNIKNKRILFILLSIFEYFFLKYVCKLNFNINFEILFGISLYLLLKLIYKDKARITDLTIYILSIIILGIISILTSITIGMNLYGLIIANIFSILLVYLLRHKLTKIDVFYNKFWNRHNDKKMIKSITIRGISSIMTIITFILLHLWLIYGIFVVRR